MSDLSSSHDENENRESKSSIGESALTHSESELSANAVDNNVDGNATADSETTRAIERLDKNRIVASSNLQTEVEHQTEETVTINYNAQRRIVLLLSLSFFLATLAIWSYFVSMVLKKIVF